MNMKDIMKAKYALIPGHIDSKNDGDEHYISAGQLCKLYGVNRNECLVIDYKNPGTFRGLNLDNYIQLHPRYDGNYKLPVKTKR